MVQGITNPTSVPTLTPTPTLRPTPIPTPGLPSPPWSAAAAAAAPASGSDNYAGYTKVMTWKSIPGMRRILLETIKNWEVVTIAIASKYGEIHAGIRITNYTGQNNAAAHTTVCAEGE